MSSYLWDGITSVTTESDKIRQRFFSLIIKRLCRSIHGFYVMSQQSQRLGTNLGRDANKCTRDAMCDEV